MKEFRIKDNLDIDDFFKLGFEERFNMHIYSNDLDIAK